MNYDVGIVKRRRIIPPSHAFFSDTGGTSMALVASPRLTMPEQPQFITLPPTHANSTALTANTHKYSWNGRVYYQGTAATKDITKVGFCFGAVTKGGSTDLIVSLEDVDLANGPPARGDGVQDQTVTIANGSIVANTWVQSGALSANRTVAFGDLLSVVLQYNTFNASDSIAIRQMPSSTSLVYLNPSIFTGSWVSVSAFNNIILEFSDGSFGTLDLGYPLTAAAAVNVNTGSTPDEVAQQFSLPFSCEIEGAWLFANVASGADFDMVLYNDTTSLVSCTIDSNTIQAAGNARSYNAYWAPYSYTKNTTLNLAVKPTTANSVTVYTQTVNDANHFQAHGWTSASYTTRSDAGSWAAPTTTQRLQCGLKIRRIHDGN
jgi:hypothetical protein